MLEHQKTILNKVSYNPGLFKKELEKSVKWLSSDELLALYTWLIVHYSSKYVDLISDVFNRLT